MPSTIVGIENTKELVAPVEPTSDYAPKTDSDEANVQKYVKTRVAAMKEYRRSTIVGNGQSIEAKWKEADREYIPHELTMGNSTKAIVTDEDNGLRGRIVELGKEDGWQSTQATPDLYVKVNTALSILVEQNPEATFEPTSRKYEANTTLAEANWKQSWETSSGRKALKTGIFNMAKYGIGIWRTFPKLDVREKRVRTEFHPEDSSKDVYETKKITRYNGLARESISPWDVWIDETARPGMFDDIGDWYFEKEFSREEFELMWPQAEFPNAKFVRPNAPLSDSGRGTDGQEAAPSIESKQDKVIVGFYENCRKDLYVVWVPELNIVLYSSPLLNEQGKLSLWFAQWTPRSDSTIYGIGIYEVIRGDTILYDRVMNMTMDQLTLSIYKSFFHKGIDQLGNDGTLRIKAGEGQVVSDPQAIKWLEIPGPGMEAWRGMQFLQDKRDTASGVPAQLAGKFAGKTLGQDLQAKEAALARMKLPLDFICDALEYEAYLTLSWLEQILSVPEMLEYQTAEELQAALVEIGLSEEEIHGYLDVLEKQPAGQELFSQTSAPAPTEPLAPGQMPEPTPAPQKFANVFPETVLNLHKDDEGNLFEDTKRRFFRYGLDLPTKKLAWKGIVRISPQSVLAPSKELTRRMDLDLFNLVMPSIQAMVTAPLTIPVAIHPIKQIIKSFGKNIKDWLDEKFLMDMYKQATQPKDSTGDNVRPSLTLQFSDLGSFKKDGIPNQLNASQKEVLKRYYGIEVQDPLFVDAGAGAPPQEAGSSGLPAAPQLGQNGVPQGEMSTRSGIESPRIADIGNAPSTMGGAVEAANRVE